jgi:hypothetical protein
VIYTLWQWSVRKDEWMQVTQAACELRRVILRGHKRRNPRGTRFRWTPSQMPPRKFRARSKA